jgi:hypothetical protein
MPKILIGVDFILRIVSCRREDVDSSNHNILYDSNLDMTSLTVCLVPTLKFL